MNRKNLLSKEINNYIFFGILTTIINYSVFALAINFLGNPKVLVANMIAFICATVFAFITNKLYVFYQKSANIISVIQEFVKFVCARLFSLGFEQIGLFIGIEYFAIGHYELFGIELVMILKIILSFISVVLNYLVSKFIVFAQKGGK